MIYFSFLITITKYFWRIKWPFIHRKDLSFVADGTHFDYFSVFAITRNLFNPLKAATWKNGPNVVIFLFLWWFGIKLRYTKNYCHPMPESLFFGLYTCVQWLGRLWQLPEYGPANVHICVRVHMCTVARGN